MWQPGRCPLGQAGGIDRQMLQPAEVMEGQAVPLWEDKGGIYSQPSPPNLGWA